MEKQTVSGNEKFRTEIEQKESKKDFNLEMFRTMTKKDAEKQSILNASNGTEAQREKMGQSCAELWKNLQESEECLLIKDKVVLPTVLLTEASLTTCGGKSDASTIRENLVPFSISNNRGNGKELPSMHVNR